MDGTVIARRTVTKLLRDLGLNRRRFIDPSGETNRKPQVIAAKRPGQMVHVDVKKVGRIPDGRGWRVHGRGSEQAKRSQRRKTKNKQGRVGYTYLHSAIDGNSSHINVFRTCRCGSALGGRLTRPSVTVG